ncbi:acyl-CoA dehydrogenase family protein [Paenibacillus luteus]|uniref:acyl-CoA dehydrogenase family protein n=1 Tax=Paenibacillus luteus TaxID=2545753 RepID=UPI001375E916|nr:acyl-CoA dehydrogenase family protein [Paenibacillus luteus]
MQFALSEELALTRSIIREFAENEIGAGAAERDAAERFDRPLFQKMAELGLTGIPIGERYGGAGGNWLTYAIILEEIARVCASTAAALHAHTVYATWPLYAYGSESARNLILPRLASGNCLGGSALPDVQIGKAKQMKTLSVKAYGTHWLLNGRHPYVLHGGNADWYMVYARAKEDKGDRDRSAGAEAFLIEGGSNGLQFGKEFRTLGLRSLIITNASFKQCSIPENYKLGRNDQGKEMYSSLTVLGYLSAAAQSVGVAQAALEAAASYAKTRKQFGTSISKQQGISFKIADMSANLDAARLLVYQAAWRKDEGLHYGRAAAIARKYAADMAVFATKEAVQIFGGNGYMQEYRMERLMRDAKCIQTEMGTGGMSTDCSLAVLSD